MSLSSTKVPQPFPPHSIWILGAGRFGRLAAERLTKRFHDADFLMIDQRPDRLTTLAEQLGVKTCAEDAIPFLAGEDLTEDLWIVPAIPVHAAFEWLLRGTGLSTRAVSIPVPESVDAQVPNPYRVSDGTVYASHATFLCPDVCSEPEALCTYTHQPRLGNLFDELAAIDLPDYRVQVLRSWQLAPGVGGYTGGQLRDLERRVLEEKGSYLIATSCRCHSVINALRWN